MPPSIWLCLILIVVNVSGFHKEDICKNEKRKVQLEAQALITKMKRKVQSWKRNNFAMMESLKRMADIWTFTHPHTKETSIFMLFKSEFNWFDAKASCIAKGGFLAKPDSQEKNDFLKRKLLSVRPKLFVWLGAERFPDGQPASPNNKWKWMDGTIAEFTDWATGEPNNWRNAENCAEFYPRMDYLWADGNCRVGKGYICEMRI